MEVVGRIQAGQSPDGLAWVMRRMEQSRVAPTIPGSKMRRNADQKQIRNNDYCAASAALTAEIFTCGTYSEQSAGRNKVRNLDALAF